MPTTTTTIIITITTTSIITTTTVNPLTGIETKCFWGFSVRVQVSGLMVLVKGSG